MLSSAPTDTLDAPVIIIGAGMAGYSLARELRKLSPDLAITLISQDAADSYAKPTLSNAFVQNKAADSIANASAEQMAETLKLTVMNFYHVSQIDTANKTLTVHPVLASDKQQVLPYTRLVLATGANPRMLPNVSVDNARIFAVNHLDEYKKFQQKIQQCQATSDAPTRVAIIGAGLIGCEFANDLVSQTSQHAMAISVFDNADLPLSSQLPPQAGEALLTALTTAGVNFQLGVTIDSIDSSNPDTLTVTVKDRNGQLQAHEFDVILVAIGLVANTALAEQAGLAVAHLNAEQIAQVTHLPRTAQQGILVNQFLQTSVPDIYALGDSANVMGSFMPYVMPLMNQARALAKTLSDQANDATAAPTAVSYPAMPVAIKTPSLPLVVLPVAAQYADSDINWQITPTEDGMVLAAFAHDNTDKLLGFVLTGKEAGKQRMTLSKQVDAWL